MKGSSQQLIKYNFIKTLLFFLLIALFITPTVSSRPVKSAKTGEFSGSLGTSFFLKNSDNSIRVFSSFPENLSIAENSVFVITSDDLGPGNEFDFSVNVLPGNTLAMFHLACICNYSSLSEIEKISIKESSVRGIKNSLNQMANLGEGPGETFRKNLITSVIRSLEAGAIQNSTFENASSTMQCQYQIQYVSEDSVGVNSAWSIGSDLHILVLVFFEPFS